MQGVGRAESKEAASTGGAKGSKSDIHQQSTNGRKAIRSMAIAVVAYAPLPLLIYLGTRQMSTYIFVAVWQVLSAALYVLIRQARRNKGQNSSSWIIIDDIKRIKPKYLGWEVLFSLYWLAFALAITLVEPVVATVIFEFWPVLFGVLTLSLWWQELINKKDEKKEQETTSRGLMLVLLFVGAVSVGFAVLSDAGELLEWSNTAIAGVGMALLATLLTVGSTAVHQLMGRHPKQPPPPPQTFKRCLCFGNI